MAAAPDFGGSLESFRAFPHSGTMAGEQVGPRGMDLPPLPEAAQRAFFDQVLAQALAAEQVAGIFEIDIALAGTTIRLSFAGAGMRDALLPALAHLQVERRGATDAVFHVWESEA
ncbi:MAG TPA: hypothetical protein VG274_05610, partial [Rhizomicrobium sp.]|nr:hypothetical protein [Rhizomicrobium sp.]